MSTFVTLGEIMIRDTAADSERLERTRLVRLSPAGSEFSVAVALSRFGIPSRFITRLPDNSYGRMMQGIAQEQNVDTSAFCWAPATEPIGRYLFEPPVGPRAGTGTYQRMFSAASRLNPSDIDWHSALRDAKLFHISGITFGLAPHSGYSRNNLAQCFEAVCKARPADCRIGLDLNYRSTLWPKDLALKTLEPVITKSCDILFASIEDLSSFLGISITAVCRPDGTVDPERLTLSELTPIANTVFERFNIELLALNKRIDFEPNQSLTYSFAFSRGRGSAALDTPARYEVVDRLGGGDAWCAGFYFGALKGNALTFKQSVSSNAPLQTALQYADAALRLQQTLMFDLPVISLSEIEDLINFGSAQRIKR